jgi:ElaB/YqjD/DUF883 family membrane-anchored ribosome-binding protein
MDQRTDDIQQTIEETRHDIEETRASMNEKLELLEERVRDTLEETRTAVGDIVDNVKGTVEETVGAVKETVDGAKSTVEDIVENVKETMDDTVTKVKRSFDLRYQVEQNPWLMVGGAVVVGSIVGSLLNRGDEDRRYYSYSGDSVHTGNYVADTTGGTGPYSISGEEDGTARQANVVPSYQAPQKQSSWTGALGQFQEEFDVVKGVVTSAVMGTVMKTLQEMIRQNIPGIASQFDEAMDRIGKKWGVKPNEHDSNHEPANGIRQEQPPGGTYYTPSRSNEPYRQGR